MKKTAIIVLFVILPIQQIFSQAGEGVFRFLSLPTSSHIAALGGVNVSMPENDLGFVFQNPSLLSLEMHNMLSVNFTSFLADITFGSAAFGRKINDNARFSVGTLFVHYGQFTERDEFGEELGNFSGVDIAFFLTYAQRLTERWSFGTTLKPVISSLERYSSFGLAVDVGMSYHNEERGLSAGFVFKNIGRQLTGYYREGSSQHIENMPFEIQAGFSTRFQHAPFRISVTAHNLQRWDMSFAGNLPDGSIAERENGGLSFGENLMRRMVFGVEILPSDSFYIAIGYNHRRNRELRVVNHSSIINGFSAGFGVNMQRLRIGASIAKYHASNTSLHFSLSTKLGAFSF